MARPPKNRDYLTRSEVSILYSLILATDEHKRRVLWTFEVLPHSPIAAQHINERLKKFSEKSGLIQRQRSPETNHKGWIWCGETTIEEYLYDQLKNHMYRVMKENPAFPDRPEWSPDAILKKLEERKERNGIRESEGATAPTSTEQRETEPS
jgi:hypothetical protein